MSGESVTLMVSNNAVKQALDDDPGVIISSVHTTEIKLQTGRLNVTGINALI